VGLSNVYGIPGLPGIGREAVVLDGRTAAEAIKTRVSARIEERRRDRRPRPVLATILVGEDPASRTYVAAKHRACAEVGIDSIRHAFKAEVAFEAVAACIDSLNNESAVSGILLQLPLPSHLDARRLLDLIDPRKDVDGLTTLNAGRLSQGRHCLVPCTAQGVLALLDHHGVELAGQRAVVVGRSDLVGRPVATLLTRRDATVTVCHSRSRDLEGECRRARVLVVAAGRRQLIGTRHVGEGAVVVDVGIHRDADGGLAGDVDFDRIRWRAQAASPVPGGVGPMTIACLLENTLIAAGIGPSRRAQPDPDSRKEPHESVR
jgi:methylenetetrahydrofolate dehydrogenase (NADP+) / methenyltetrahydrofolate cyclohydrolase